MGERKAPNPAPPPGSKPEPSSWNYGIHPEISDKNADARRFRYLHTYLCTVSYGSSPEALAALDRLAEMSLDELREWCDLSEAQDEAVSRINDESLRDFAEHFEEAARREESEAQKEYEHSAHIHGGFCYLARLATSRRLREYAELFRDAEKLGVDRGLVAMAIRDALIQEIEDLLEATA